MKVFVILSTFFACSLFSSPFDYDLNEFTIPGKNERTMIAFHGYGGNYQIAETIKEHGDIDSHLVSFNFPEYDRYQRDYDHNNASFGTIHELLPALFVLKKKVIDEKKDAIDLYGYSAGGGVLVNLLSVLHKGRFPNELKKIGIGKLERKQLLKAIQNGMVILDTPVKSVEEIIDHSGITDELRVISKQYQTNKLRPIDSIKSLKGLSLDVLLHFQEKDEILYNRDDAEYIARLKKANRKGKTHVVIGDDGGHSKPHDSLWKSYKEKMSSK